jgi:hypothetical protein
MAITNEDKDVYTFEKFLGLRNTVGEESFELGDLSIALNVDQTDAFRLRRRKGFEATSITVPHQSLWSDGVLALSVNGTDLVQIMPDLTARVVRSGLTAGVRMHYASIGARVFYSNGVEFGVFEDGSSRSWGLQLPSKLPLVQAIGGSLPAGDYQYTMTFIRSDGQESGAPASGNITLLTMGGLRFYDLPVSTDPDVLFKRIYITPVNGDQPYSLQVMPNSATETTYMDERIGTLPLMTQFLSPALPSRLIAAFAGHILLARGHTLYRSEPYAPELFDLRKGLPFTDRITLVAPMEDGVYLGTESEVMWLAGMNPAEWKLDRKSVHGAILGTAAYGPAEDVAESQQGPAVLYVSTKGVVAGFNGGSLLSLTEERFGFPIMDEGAAIIRHHGGTVQYIVTLRGVEGVSNVAF